MKLFVTATRVRTGRGRILSQRIVMVGIVTSGGRAGGADRLGSALESF